MFRFPGEMVTAVNNTELLNFYRALRGDGGSAAAAAATGLPQFLLTAVDRAVDAKGKGQAAPPPPPE